jgi:hypothetical protein
VLPHRSRARRRARAWGRVARHGEEHADGPEWDPSDARRGSVGVEDETISLANAALETGRSEQLHLREICSTKTTSCVATRETLKIQPILTGREKER